MKKAVAIICSLGTAFLGLLVILGTDSCYVSEYCRAWRKSLSHDWMVMFFVFPVALVFSAITYSMKGEVFRKWAKFSAWYIPLLIAAHFVFSGSSGDFGAGGAIQDSFNMLMLGLGYAIYVVVSIVKIVRARRV